ncbi:MAG: family 10 glycosylhydrolase [Prevotella sp.]|nr:family 10 glycosylhydrolase [Prevotella sp.]MCI1282031.1 family 10 glycosylhydrolase [Prevotella sp.]
MKRLFTYLITCICILSFVACGSSNDVTDSGGGSGNNGGSSGGNTGKTEAKPRYIWIDASANFPRFADSKENIREDLTKAKNAGFTDIVVDVRPSMGDVLYKTSYTDQITKLDYWTSNGQYKYYERKATWDYLQAFIDIGHELGLKVDAAFNTFTGGCLNPYGLGELGMVFRDATKRSWVTTLNLKQGLTNEMDLTSTNPSDDNYYGTKFLNPCNNDVQEYVLNLIGDLCKYNIDALFLDRCRFDDLQSDFSDVTKEKFLKYLGVSSINFPDDVMAPGTKSAPSSQPKYFKDWLAFRAKTISEFVGKAVAKVRSINSNIKVGVYVGAWYSEYYEMGVNWASTSYDPRNDYPEWANADYHKYGYANRLDFMLLGCYASADNVYGTTEWTMQGFCKEAKKKIGNGVKFAGGPDVGNADGFVNGGANQAVTNSVDACINASDGYFLFDLSQVRQFDYWNSLKQGIDKYLNTIK